MRLLNIIDDKNRFCGFKVDITARLDNAQVDSHTMSYIYVRKQYQSAGLIMGLDTLPYGGKHDTIKYDDTKRF